MKTTRRTAVAGRFYPDRPDALESSVRGYLSSAPQAPPTPLAALIAPHAGYIYSGPIAGSAYQGLPVQAGSFNRVVIIGPSHTLAFRGVAAPSADQFESPLGDIRVDQAAVSDLVECGLAIRLDEAHAREHGIEVHLPFLQLTLDRFELVPLVTGSVDSQVVADIIDRQLDQANTLVVISSDLSHYYDYTTAQRMDRFTADAIEAEDPSIIEPEHACGRTAIQGLLTVARDRGWNIETVDLRNSGDTAGPKTEVVGYGAFRCHAE